jgi:hypothetical protein
MVSTFSWLDTSEADRRRAMDVIDLLRQKETVDELGIGSVRDTIADFLSPGTSTVQRRARYFFFIPWIYQKIERSPAAANNVAGRARQAEIALIDVLAASADPAGTIGIEARGSLKRLPSMVYWSGLGRLGFRVFPGSQDQYHRILGRRTRAASVSIDDVGDLAPGATATANWHPRLPEPPVRFPDEADFALRKPEAGFFRDQLRIHASDSLLLFLVEAGKPVESLEFPWQHPSIAEMSERLRRWLHHGQMFSELMVGAAYLYNLMLSEQLPNPEWVEAYQKALNEWATSTDERRSIYVAWNRDEFWRELVKLNPRLPPGVRQFAEQWIQRVLSVQAKFPQDPDARALIAERERRLKGRRARLANREQLLLWGGASGAFQLDYRWGITTTVVNDIVRGLTA